MLKGKQGMSAAQTLKIANLLFSPSASCISLVDPLSFRLVKSQTELVKNGILNVWLKAQANFQISALTHHKIRRKLCVHAYILQVFQSEYSDTLYPLQWKHPLKNQGKAKVADEKTENWEPSGSNTTVWGELWGRTITKHYWGLCHVSNQRNKHGTNQRSWCDAAGGGGRGPGLASLLIPSPPRNITNPPLTLTKDSLVTGLTCLLDKPPPPPG